FVQQSGGCGAHRRSSFHCLRRAAPTVRRPSSLTIPKSILDTDILSEYLKGHDSVVVGHAARYAREHGVFSFTTVTVYEIVYGLELKGASSQLKNVLAWLARNDSITPAGED